MVSQADEEDGLGPLAEDNGMAPQGGGKAGRGKVVKTFRRPSEHKALKLLRRVGWGGFAALSRAVRHVEVQEPSGYQGVDFSRCGVGWRGEKAKMD